MYGKSIIVLLLTVCPSVLYIHIMLMYHICLCQSKFTPLELDFSKKFLLFNFCKFLIVKVVLMMYHLCCCWCCCFCPPVSAVCPNHEAVMFQPRTGTDPDLVSVTVVITFILVTSHPTCFTHFLDISKGRLFCDASKNNLDPRLKTRCDI